MKNKLKALEAIEILVGEDFGFEMENILYNKDKNIDPILKQAAKIITDIYCIAHSETKHHCQHPEWEKIKYKILAEYNKKI